jgi:hypothetical protein
MITPPIKPIAPTSLASSGQCIVALAPRPASIDVRFRGPIDGQKFRATLKNGK